MISQARLKELLYYDPDTGIWSWRVRRQSVAPGQIAGTTHHTGYIIIAIDRKQYAAHRLAALYMTCEWPANQIDHINRVKSDNRWNNLRNATNALNKANTAKTKRNTTGFKGVFADKRTGRWSAACGDEYLGMYGTKEEASQAYAKASIRKYGEYAKF